MNIGGAGGRRRIIAPSGTGSQKDREDDLVLFREMVRREKERNFSLLQPVVSEEFDHNNGIYPYPLYRTPSWKKGLTLDLPLPAEGEKNDYDWLKTPPATPLFPSLDMEANNPNLTLQREITILQPPKPSRFAGKREEPKPISRQKSPAPGFTSSRTKNPIPTGKSPQMVESKAAAAERGRIRRPSPTGGRKDVAQQESEQNGAVGAGNGSGITEVGSVVVGSRMVEKVMKARRAAAAGGGGEGGEGKGVQPKERGAKETSSYHRHAKLLSQSPHDTGMKQHPTGIIRKSANVHQKQEGGRPKSLTSKSNTSSSASTPRVNPRHEAKDDRNLLKKATGRHRCAMC